MTNTNNVTILRLTPQVRTLLKLMSFPELAPEANYLSFDEDGNAQQINTFETNGFRVPTMVFVSYYADVELHIEE